MGFRYIHIILGTVALFLMLHTPSMAQDSQQEGHILVSMRVIGHEILMDNGDSTSRVLPIEKEGNRYKISFTSNFYFIPDELVATIDGVIQKAKIAKHYRVEIQECESNRIVYSYEMGNSDSVTLISCKMRIQPEGCYYVLISILDTLDAVKSADKTGGSLSFVQLFGLLTIIFSGVAFIGYYWTKKNEDAAPTNLNLISIGTYQFDPVNMVLSFEGKTTELTSKESDLLHLLYRSANTTLERETILRDVWGDEGAYVGRTLDVFISKLRKKLADDTNLKIVNIRGIGYRFVIN